LLKIREKDRLLKGLEGEELAKRKQLLDIAEKVLNEINPEKLVEEALRDFNMADFENIYVVGSGKGTAAMAQAAENVLDDRIAGGVITIPEGTTHSLARVQVIPATHPLPNKAGVSGSRQILEMAREAGENDLVIALISGGGSALLPLPVDGVNLDEKVEVTSLLLKSGATIQEMNQVRKHLSQIKGGWLAKAVYPAKCLHLVISDVLGDDLGTIASGPLAPDESTFADARAVLEQYEIWDEVPESVRVHLEAAENETPKPGDPVFEGVTTHILANHETPAQIVKELVPGCEVLTTNLNGEARDQATALLKRVKEPGVLYVATGETTVTICGDGKGGRNQEFMLAMARSGFNGVALSIGTDGVDGMCPELTAGAIISPRTLKAGVAIDEYLDNNDSYHFFEKTGDLIQTGPSGTNLGDLIMILR
jgi:glycerate 2-kinase